MMNLLFQAAAVRPNTSLRRLILTTFRHLGAVGLFSLAMVDSSPVPTFCGPDVLVAILVATHANPWYECAAAAAAGSIVGAYLTYRLAHKAGETYLESKFGKARVDAFLKVFEKWGSGVLAASSAIPFPFPTSMVFAAAGASAYPIGAYMTVVALARCARYTLIALLAERYGRHLVRVFLHPVQYWGWLLVFAAVVALLVGFGVVFNRRLFGPGETRAEARV